MRVEDAFGNTITTGADSTTDITVALQTGTGSLQGTVTKTAVAGVATFTNLRIDSSGAKTLRASGTLAGPGAVSVDSNSFTIYPAIVNSLLVTTSAGAPQTAGLPFDITVTAKDSFGNTVTGYTGTVKFTSSDGQATLPADYTFVGGDNGAHTFTSGVTLKTADSQSVTATDQPTTSISGTANVTVGAGTS